ncbi:hypothetical protein [Bradyrhizobium sp. 17]|uniref:hypothetical protein n=1 Tax=Bradyrhizobium sp. 17 TaxID=2782649 RepID=UPI001FFAD96E|nr:hypothetical protein [Bradyrhizobium sp. 17]
MARFVHFRLLRAATLSLVITFSAMLPARAEDPAAYPTHKSCLMRPVAAAT